MLSHNSTIFEKKKVVEHEMCVLTLSTIWPVILLIITSNERNMIKSVYWFSCEVRVTLVSP